MGYIEDWADEYMRRHVGESVDVRNFSLSDEEYDDFCRFIEDKDVPYESETRQALTALRKAAESERYDETIAASLDALEQMIKDDKMSNMQIYRDEIVKAINYEHAPLRISGGCC